MKPSTKKMLSKPFFLEIKTKHGINPRNLSNFFRARTQNHGRLPLEEWTLFGPTSNRGKRLRRGVLWSITGDLEWFCQEFGFPWASSNLLCPYCQADQMKKDSKHRFLDFRPSFASWRKNDILQGGPQGQVYQPPLVENTYCFQVCPKNPGFPQSNPILGMTIVSTMNPTLQREGSGFLGDGKEKTLALAVPSWARYQI